MNILSLFSGAGGGDIASFHLLNHRIIGYVEINNYCQQVIAQRIKDGLLPNAPIFGDVRAFIDQGFVDAYQGMVDCITGGFPCQPFSVAGRRQGKKDERNMWPETIECIRKIRPRYTFLENVPGILSSGYFGRILGDLAEAGYDAKWCVLGGHEVGGISDGKRVWIACTSPDCSMLEGVDVQKYIKPCEEESCRRQFARAVRATLSQDDYTRIKRDSNAVAHGMDRLKAIGNGQVPAVAATAWKILMEIEP